MRLETEIEIDENTLTYTADNLDKYRLNFHISVSNESGEWIRIEGKVGIDLVDPLEIAQCIYTRGRSIISRYLSSNEYGPQSLINELIPFLFSLELYTLDVVINQDTLCSIVFLCGTHGPYILQH